MGTEGAGAVRVRQSRQNVGNVSALGASTSPEVELWILAKRLGDPYEVWCLNELIELHSAVKNEPSVPRSVPIGGLDQFDLELVHSVAGLGTSLVSRISLALPAEDVRHVEVNDPETGVRGG